MPAIDPLRKWRLNLNDNSLYILSLVLMFQDKGFFYMNVRLRMYKYSYLNVGAIYAKGLWLKLYLALKGTMLNRICSFISGCSGRVGT